MDLNHTRIAVLCYYQLLPERVGGMDYFFWMFDQKCKEKGIAVDWFFPNESIHGGYTSLHIITKEHQDIEPCFLEYCKNNNPCYEYVITHFIELCIPFYKSIKTVCDAKIIAVDHNPRPLGGYSLLKKIEKRVKGFLYSKYVYLFVGVSNYTVNEIIKDYGKLIRGKVITVYNGVLLHDIISRNTKSTKKPKFLVASHLRKSKGIQDLIEAVFLLPKAIQNEVHIDIYGDGPYKEYLLNKTIACNVDECFTFMGSKPNLKEIFCNYDYMLQPTHMECFSLSILESLAANVPVITTSVGGNEEVINDAENGFIYKAKDVVALSNLIKELILGNKQITITTRLLIETTFSIETMVDNHIKLLL